MLIQKLYTKLMITDVDVNKLKQTFTTKDDLDKSESRTAFGFADVQKRLNVLTADVKELKIGQKELQEGQTELKEGLMELKEEFGDMKQQMTGMEQNIISAIHELRDDLVETKKRVTKLENIVLAN